MLEYQNTKLLVLKCWVSIIICSVLFISTCKQLKSQRASDMSLVPSIARDITGAAVDLESVPEIIKYTFNLSACMENDLWMNFKQHASVCNLANELCGSDLRSVTQYRAKRFSTFTKQSLLSPTASNFRTVSTLLLHILPLWLRVVSWKCVGRLLFSSMTLEFSILLTREIPCFQDFLPPYAMSVKQKDTMFTFTDFYTVSVATASNKSSFAEARHTLKILFMRLLSTSRERWQVFHQSNDKNLKMPFQSHEQSRASCSLLMLHSALMSFCLSTPFQFLIHFVSAHSSLFFLYKWVSLKGPFIFFVVIC